VYSTPDEGEVLTPAHFLIGRRLIALPENNREARDTGKAGLLKRWRLRRQLVSSFWTRWQKEYLMDLRSVHEVKQPKGEVPFKVGDVALIHDEKLPRQMWKTGRIHELTKGRDSKIRSVGLKLTNGQLIRRPIQLVYPLEINFD